MSSDKDQSIFAGALFAGALLTYLFVSHEKLERSKRVKRRWEKIHKYIGEISRSHEKPISKSHASATSSADDKEKKQEVSHGRVLENACISEIRLHDIDMLQSHHNSANKPNEAWHNPKDADAFQCGQHKYNKLVTDDEYILHNIIRGKHNSSGASAKSEAFMRAGPRAFTHFDPLNVNAAIVCSGGLCPGLNNVIREIVDTLHYQYGVNSVRGIM